MKFKLFEFLQILEPLTKILQQELPGHVSWWLLRDVRQIEKLHSDVVKIRDELVTKYGEPRKEGGGFMIQRFEELLKDEAGNVIPGQELKETKKWQEYSKASNDKLNVEMEVSIHPLDLEALTDWAINEKKPPLSISGAEWLALEKFVKEPEPKDTPGSV